MIAFPSFLSGTSISFPPNFILAISSSLLISTFTVAFVFIYSSLGITLAIIFILFTICPSPYFLSPTSSDIIPSSSTYHVVSLLYIGNFTPV